MICPRSIKIHVYYHNVYVPGEAQRLRMASFPILISRRNIYWELLTEINDKFRKLTVLNVI